LSNAAFASSSTIYPFCFSSVNILFASSTGRAALDRLQDVGIGLKIENINVNNTGYADDIALLSTQLSDAQIMVNMALDFANHPNRLYALRLALVIFSSTLVWILCFIVVVLMIPK
jgi:hypothetical protein